MTYEKLERANELADTLEDLSRIQGIFCTHARTQGDDELDFVTIARERYGVVNIPSDICNKIISLVEIERAKIQEEFDEL